MLGLCAKAGKLDSGEFSCEKGIKSGKAVLCILASDTSDNTKKHFKDMCSYRNIRTAETDRTKSELGHLVGKKERSVVTVNDKGFSDSILRLSEGGRANG